MFVVVIDISLVGFVEFLAPSITSSLILEIGRRNFNAVVTPG